MGAISRVDRILGATVVALLCALAGLAVADRAQPGTRLTAPPPHAAKGRPGAASSPPPGLPSLAAGFPTPTTSTAPAAGTISTGSVPPPASGQVAAVPLPVPGPVTAVGDSIMLDIGPYLTADVPGVIVDGLVSRQFGTGIGVVQSHRADGTLGNVLVVELGTNGAIAPSDVDAMVQAASGVQRVVFVTIAVPRPWTAPDNAVLAAGVDRHPGVAALADWSALAAGHPEWFTADQVHLDPSGAQALAALIARYT